MATATAHDWTAPVTKTRPIGAGKSESFLVVFTADDAPGNGAITNNHATHIGKNAHGQDVYGTTVKLIEDYTNFDSIPNIVRISHGEHITPLFAQPVDPSGVTYPDPDKAVKWF